jgi:phosphatidylglycerophosphate synthase
MIIQSVALYLFLLGGILELETWMTIGWYLLWPALVLAVISGSKQVIAVWRAQRGTVGDP